MDGHAWVLRIAPSGIDRIDHALAENVLLIGWSRAQGLEDEAEWGRFREIVHRAYHEGERGYRKSGAAAGHLWRFIHDMKVDDLVVVPHGASFYVARITGAPLYDVSKVGDDTAYRRPVEWLNQGTPIPRRIARARLVSRMKYQATCVEATDLLGDIQEAVDHAKEGSTPTMADNLQKRVRDLVLAELREGRMDDYAFERLLQALLEHFGAVETRIVPRNKDKGADLVGTFVVGGFVNQKVAIQAKHWRPDPPLGRAVVEKLIEGMKAEQADIGVVVTTGAIDDGAFEAAEEYSKSGGGRIELVDGPTLATLLVEHGVRMTRT